MLGFLKIRMEYKMMWEEKGRLVVEREDIKGLKGPTTLEVCWVTKIAPKRWIMNDAMNEGSIQQNTFKNMPHADASPYPKYLHTLYVTLSLDAFLFVFFLVSVSLHGSSATLDALVSNTVNDRFVIHHQLTNNFIHFFKLYKFSQFTFVMRFYDLLLSHSCIFW